MVQEIWLSSNLGTDPVRLVFAVGGTRFGALAFSADGETLLYGAVHGDNAPLLHALDLTDPTTNQGLWHGEPGDRIDDISTQPTRDGDLIAMTVGSTCADSRALLFERDQEPRVLARSPSRVVGWLGGESVLVATGRLRRLVARSGFRGRRAGRCGDPLDRRRRRRGRADPPAGLRADSSPPRSRRRWAKASADERYRAAGRPRLAREASSCRSSNAGEWRS